MKCCCAIIILLLPNLISARTVNTNASVAFKLISLKDAPATRAGIDSKGKALEVGVGRDYGYYQWTAGIQLLSWDDKNPFEQRVVPANWPFGPALKLSLTLVGPAEVWQQERLSKGE